VDAGVLSRRDPDTGAWFSEPRALKTPTRHLHPPPTKITARIIVRRIKDARSPDAPSGVAVSLFFTNADLPVTEADGTHR
jgi:hypothetical protein